MTPEQLNEIKKRLSTYHEAKATCDKDDVRVTIPRDQLIDDTAALVEQVDNLAHELKCSNETIDMLYQRSSNFAQQADTHEAEVKRLREVVRQVHGLAEAAVRGTAVGAWLQTQEIHKITKGMVE